MAASQTSTVELMSAARTTGILAAGLTPDALQG
jgi:hypothetical protein